jgi:hypothetical protein
MVIRSISDKRYSRRFLLMGAAICGFSLWCLYDGLVRYPREQQRGLAFDKLAADGRQNEWDEIAKSRGWSASPPEEPLSAEDFQNKVWMQFAMAGLTAAIGLPMVLLALASRGKWIDWNGSTITTSWGESFTADQVQQINKRRWQKKGIAKVTYQDGQSKRRFVIDDFKFERPTMDRILYELEQRIDPERIVNGPPELPPDQPLDAGREVQQNDVAAEYSDTLAGRGGSSTLGT